MIREILAPSTGRYWRFAALALLLALHFLTRHAAAHAIPLSMRNDGMYSCDYRVALNLLSGRGLHQSVLPDAPEAKPLRDFSMLRRAGLKQEELEAYLRQPWARTVSFDPRTHVPDVSVPEIDRDFVNEFYTMRVLDLHLAALLWKVFGIQWSVLFTFYELVSTATALLLFLIARKAGGYWAGVVALILYTAAPIENQGAIRAIRDTSPLWFGILAFAAFFCLAGSFRSRAANLASFAIAGFAAAVGYGWRLDALQLPPIILVVLLTQGLLERTPIRSLALRAAIFVCGALICFGGIRMLTNGGSESAQTGFHIAYYGNAVRANLLGLENSLQIFRCDVNTRVAAFSYAAANHLPDGGAPYLSSAYGRACRQMYLRAFGFDAWHWVTRFPLFILHAMRATTLKDLPINRDYYAPEPSWPRWISPVRKLILDPLSWLAPALVVLGIAAVCFWTPFSMVATSMVFLLPVYAAILFAVLPEYKHAGMLVMPMCILGSVGVTSLLVQSKRKTHWKIGGLLLFSVAVVWAAASIGAYFWSSFQRTQQILDIRQVAAHASPDPNAQVLPQLLLVRRPAGAVPERVGYLLEIEAGPHPGSLTFRQRCEGIETRFHESEHVLHANKRQFFFFTAYQDTSDNSKQYSATVLVGGGARIISAVRTDLSEWKGLEVSTVFYDGERVAGSPSAGHPSERSVYGPGSVDDDLLYMHERLRLTPNSGNGLGPTTFTAAYSKTGGANDLQVVYLTFGSALNGANSCAVGYQAGNNQLFLFNDAATATATLRLGGGGSVSNSQCTLWGGGTAASMAGTGLAVPFAITFKNTFTRAKTIFGLAQTYDGTQSAVTNLGSWTPQ
jgi:hypothetical protein